MKLQKSTIINHQCSNTRNQQSYQQSTIISVTTSQHCINKMSQPWWLNWHICHKRKLLFLFVILTHLPMFLLKFWSGELVGCGIWFRIQRVLHYRLLVDPATPKTRNTWKNVTMTSSSHFLGISYFWSSGVLQKYAEWVLVGCRI